MQTGSKKGINKARHFLGLHTNTNANIIRCEPVFVESCERQQQQLVFCLNIGKLHAQLRRLRNESSLLDDAVITAIPPYSSKVLFTCVKSVQPCRTVEYYLQPANSANAVSNIYTYCVLIYLIFMHTSPKLAHYGHLENGKR